MNPLWSMSLIALLPLAGGPDADRLLTERARLALRRAPALSSANLGVAVRDGRAEVWGTVPSEATRNEAMSTLRLTPGVRSVHADILIRPEAPPKMVVATPDDAGVPEPVVMNEMPLIPRPPKPSRTPKVENQIVESAKRDNGIEAPQLRIPHVELQPAVASLATETVEVRVRRYLTTDPTLAGLRFELRDGVVTLYGRLKKWDDLWIAADEISRLPGVERVVIAGVSSR